jgi:WD40 repeat protein
MSDGSEVLEEKEIRARNGTTASEETEPAPLLTLRGHRHCVSGVDFSPDGEWIASVGYDGLFKIWDLQAGHERISFPPGGGFLYSVAFSPNGKMVASGKYGTVNVWDAARGQEILTLQEARAPTFSPDSQLLAVGVGREDLRVYEIATSREVFACEARTCGRVLGTAFSFDGKWVASAHENRQTVKIWHAVSGDEMLTLDHAGRTVAFSRDGRLFACCKRSPSTLEIRELISGQLVRTFAGTMGQPSFSPDGKWITAGSDDGQVKIWDLTTGQPRFALRAHTGRVFQTKFSPDGTRVATAGEDRAIRVWDLTRHSAPEPTRDRTEMSEQGGSRLEDSVPE